MKNVIIVCAGNRAKEIHADIYKVNKIAEEKNEEPPYNLLGFINDIPNTLDGTSIKEPVLGSIIDWYPKGDELYIMGTADPKGKEKLANMLKARGCRFTSIISPNAIVSSDLVMGEGCVIEAVRIGCGVKLGDFVSINSSLLMSGAQIDDFSTTTGFTVVENAKIGKRVFVGSHAVITNGTIVGNDAKIGIGSIVTQNVADGTTVFGIPAAETGW